jgi:hypothetical protein
MHSFCGFQSNAVLPVEHKAWPDFNLKVGERLTIAEGRLSVWRIAGYSDSAETRGQLGAKGRFPCDEALSNPKIALKQPV